MVSLVLGFFMLATAQAETFAAPGKLIYEAASDPITQSEEKKIILLLNNFCGDAWCEGSYDIQFKSIRFSPSHEVYILAAATTADMTDESTANSIGFRCEIKDATVVLDTLRAAAGEDLYQAERRLFDIVSDCIDTALYLKP